MSIQDEVNKVLGTAGIAAGGLNALTDKNIELNKELNEELLGKLAHNEEVASKELGTSVEQIKQNLNDPNFKATDEQKAKMQEFADTSKELIDFNSKARIELQNQMKNLGNARSIISKWKANKALGESRESIPTKGKEYLQKLTDIDNELKKGGI